MRCFMLWTICLILVNLASAQGPDPVKWYETKLRNKTECKNAESSVAECAEYMLTHPYDHSDVPYHCAENLVIRWMEKTKEYHFTISPKIMNYETRQNGLLAIYMAAMAQIALKSPGDLADDNKTQLAAMTAVAIYCQDPAHKVEITPAINELINAYKNGKLASIITSR